MAECNYDGGDCCGMDINDQYCEECICHDHNEDSGDSGSPGHFISPVLLLQIENQFYFISKVFFLRLLLLILKWCFVLAKNIGYMYLRLFNT